MPLPTGTAFGSLCHRKRSRSGATTCMHRQLEMAERLEGHAARSTRRSSLRERKRGRGRSDSTTDATWAATAGGVRDRAGSDHASCAGASILGALESRMQRVPFKSRVPGKPASGIERRVDRAVARHTRGRDRLRHARLRRLTNTARSWCCPKNSSRLGDPDGGADGHATP